MCCHNNSQERVTALGLVVGHERVLQAHIRQVKRLGHDLLRPSHRRRRRQVAPIITGAAVVSEGGRSCGDRPVTTEVVGASNTGLQLLGGDAVKMRSFGQNLYSSLQEDIPPTALMNFQSPSIFRRNHKDSQPPRTRTFLVVSLRAHSCLERATA